METKYQLAQTMVRAAGSFLREHLHDCLDIEIKTHHTDVVTHLDKQVQQQLEQTIRSHYPMDRIFGEEGGDVSSIAHGNVWVIDPIDGTANFIAQKNDFAILLAYFEEGVGQFGLIYNVMDDKLFHGGGRFPVLCNQDRLEKACLVPLEQGLIGVNARNYASNAHGLADLAGRCLGTRAVGSAGIGFSHVLEGRLVAYASYLYPWDYAAAHILGQVLGFELISLEGEEPSYSDREFVMLLPKGHLKQIGGYLF